MRALGCWRVSPAGERKEDGLTFDTGGVVVARDGAKRSVKVAAFLTLISTLATVGCAAPSGPATGDGDATAPHRETVTASPELDGLTRQAVERWSVATGRDWTYVGAVEADVGADFHVQVGQPPETFVAFAYANGRIVVSPEWLATPELEAILMHELGHAFRGDHHDGPGVMYYGIGDGVMTPCLTPADLLWACQDYDCVDFGVECEQPTGPSLEPTAHAWALCPNRAERVGIEAGPTPRQLKSL